MAEESKITIKIDNSRIVNDAMSKQLQNGLMGCGAEAEGYAKGECPVDTGRLRNSITFATASYHSAGNDSSGAKATSEEIKAHGTPETATVYLGTNVEYAPQQEYRDMGHKTGKAHFLRDAITTHTDHYKAIIEAALKA